MLLVSDVHGEFDGLAEVAASGETLLVLGDLINLMDYRTGEGIVADILGIDFALRSAQARARGDYAGMRALWEERVGDDIGRYRAAFDRLLTEQYTETRRALTGATAYVTFGNVDRPGLLRDSLPEGCVFVHGDTIVIEGLRIGFAGGGVSTPLGAEGEVPDDEMRRVLAGLGTVDVLCSHLPPAVVPLHRDVVTGRLERSSRPILEYILDTKPAYHFFGDVHQPQASRWRVGSTLCQNVGYFRATRRPVRFEP